MSKKPNNDAKAVEVPTKNKVIVTIIILLCLFLFGNAFQIVAAKPLEPNILGEVYVQALEYDKDPVNNIHEATIVKSWPVKEKHLEVGRSVLITTEDWNRTQNRDINLDEYSELFIEGKIASVNADGTFKLAFNPTISTIDYSYSIEDVRLTLDRPANGFGVFLYRLQGNVPVLNLILTVFVFAGYVSVYFLILSYNPENMLAGDNPAATEQNAEQNNSHHEDEVDNE